jgi:hypothetical protein
MNGKLTKILPLAGLFCGSLFCQAAHAATQDDATDSTMPSTTKEITPPAGFAADPGIGFSLYADFIYWEARQPNLGFAATGVAVDGDAVATLAPGEIYYPSFNYKPGFKVGLGFDVGHDNWDIDANYTWLNGSASKNSVTRSSSDPSALLNLFPIDSGVTDPIMAADGDWFLHHNLINANLGRNYFISQFLTLRPYFGLSGAWNNQKEVVHYDSEGSSSGLFVTIHNKQNYWGVGFNTGLQTAWLIDENWAIYGNLGFMNLWSKYRVQSKETNYLTVAGTIDPTSEAIAYYSQDVEYGFQNVVDIELGVRYGLRFDDNNMGFAMQLGWEQQVWINHAQYQEGNSNLSLQGLTARVRFDF